MQSLAQLSKSKIELETNFICLRIRYYLDFYIWFDKKSTVSHRFNLMIVFESLLTTLGVRTNFWGSSNSGEKNGSNFKPIYTNEDKLVRTQKTLYFVYQMTSMLVTTAVGNFSNIELFCIIHFFGKKIFSLSELKPHLASCQFWIYCKIHPVVNFTNILRAAFASIFLCQKSANLKCKYKLAVLESFEQKSNL